jgi:2-haloacid dehalogenase
MTSSNISSVIFDFGGVLLDWNPHNLYRRFFPDPQDIDRFLDEINFKQWNFQQDQGRPFAEGVAELSARFPQYSDLIRAYSDYWEESIVGPIEGTVSLLRRIKKAGYSVFGLSNWSAETFPIAYDKYDFFKLFDEIIISGEVKVAKPEPIIFEILLNRIKRLASECLLIDDSMPNITTAQNMGMKTIYFRSPSQLEMELQNKLPQPLPMES